MPVESYPQRCAALAYISDMSIRQRLYPDPSTIPMLAKHCQDARTVWNLGLEQRNLWQPNRAQKINYISQAHELTEARKALEWLGEGSSSVQQAALRDLDRAFQNWWKRPDHFGRPTWRKAGIDEGFCIRDLSVRRINRRWGAVQVPKCGWVRFRLTRQFSDIEAASSARVTLDRSGRWHTSFTAAQPSFQREPTGSAVGLDMGVHTSVATSNGVHLRMPKLLSPGEAQRKRRLQRKMARQTKGSNRRNRTKLSIAKLSAKESDRRKDWIEKTTTILVRDYDFIAIEDLRVKDMTRSGKGTRENPGKNVFVRARFNRSIRNQAWAMFRKRLTDKATAATSPVEVIPINPEFTSLRCPDCGYTADENRKSQAVFVCRSCNHKANADVNAAINILADGQSVAGRGGTSHARSVKTEHSDPAKRQPLVGDAA